MKLDELREALKRAPKPIKRPKPKALRCNKCSGPRERARLTDPDVAQILRLRKRRKNVIGAYRCAPCRLVWIVERVPPPPMHHRCRSKKAVR